MPRTSLTPKSSKAPTKPSNPRRHVRRAAPVILKQILPPLRLFMFVLLASCYSSVSQLTLSPVYGSIPVSLYHSGIETAVFSLAWITTYSFWEYFPQNLPAWPPILASWIPVIQYILFPHSYHYGATRGPVITECLTYFPLLYLSISSAAQILNIPDFRDLFNGQSLILTNFASGSVCYWFFRNMERAATSLLQSHRPKSTSFFLTRFGLQHSLGALFAVLSPSKWLFLTVPALLHSALWNVHNPLLHTTTLLNSTLQTQSDYQILARQDSLTGYLSVLYNTKDRFRVLRCDHSLLGGEWLLPESREPVYAVFVMLEAVRLVVPVDEDSRPPALQLEELSKSGSGPVAEVDPVPDSAKGEEYNQKTALVVGLGIGTSVTALIAHGIETTVVEIDPVVHEFAERYFGLPSNHTSVIEDAVTFVATARNQKQRYSYIIHDVFTGGAEPAPLFTVDFISGLWDLLALDGVIAINYGGDLLMPSARLIVRTINAVFPVCRIFRENVAPSPVQLMSIKHDFTNLVIFCTKSDNPFSFRKPTEGDFLGSHARREHLWPKHEVDPEVFQTDSEEERMEVLKAGETMRMLQKWQEQSALSHWAIMRAVIPDKVWENW